MNKEAVLQAMRVLWMEVLDEEPESRFNIRIGLLRLATKLNLDDEFGREIESGW